MTESHAGYRVAPSQMDDLPVHYRLSENFTKSKHHYEKSGNRCLGVANHLDFFMRYKITVFTAIVSIVALLLFSASIIYMALQSADNCSPLRIEKIVDEDPAQRERMLKGDENQEIDKSHRSIASHFYEIVPESVRNLHKYEIGKIRKRRTPELSDLKNRDSISLNNRRFRRIGTGSKVSRGIEAIPTDDPIFQEINNDVEESQNNGKRETDRKETMSSCLRSVDYCSSILESMKSMIKTTGDNVQNLNKLVDQLKIKDGTSKPDWKVEDYLQCVECKKTFNDAITFPEPSSQERAMSYQDKFDDPHINTPMKSMSSIVAVLNDGSSSIEATDKIDKVETTESPVVHNGDTSSPSTIKKITKDIEKTVQVAKSQRIKNGREVTQIIKNTTIIKQPTDESSSKEIPKVETPSGTTQGILETSTGSSLELESLTTQRESSTFPVESRPDVPTERLSTIPYLSGTSEDSHVDASGWTETTKTHATMEQSSSDSTVAPVIGKSSQAWHGQKDETMPGGLEPRIMTEPQYQRVKGMYDGGSITLPTAETMKTSQQVQYTPSVSWMPQPVCFYGAPGPGAPAGPFKQSMPGSMTFPGSAAPNANYPFLGNQFNQKGYGFSNQPTGPFGPPQYQQSGPIFPYGIPASGFQGTRVGPTGSGTPNGLPNFMNLPTGPGQGPRAPYYCTYMPAPTFQFPTIPGISEFQRSSDYSDDSVSKTYPIPDSSWNVQGWNYPVYMAECDRNSHRCDDGSRCVLKTTWCDGNVDCPDASDEIKCSCRDRIVKDKICDGYFDCPRGEDELGCFDGSNVWHSSRHSTFLPYQLVATTYFHKNIPNRILFPHTGCSPNSFSCEDWSRSRQRGNCVPLSQRCDGLKQCPNGKDEKDCSILTQSYIENEDVFTVGYTTGFLHKNWQGRWYPVCTPTQSWATEACIGETGTPLRGSPRIDVESTPPRNYRVSYLAQAENGEIKVMPTCNDKAIYVRCPEIPCGTRLFSRQKDHSTYDEYEDVLVASMKKSPSSKNGTNEVEEITHDPTKLSKTVDETLDDSKDLNKTNSEIVGDSRVVGGRASQPKAWPFLVAIYRNGYFHCGGVIIDQEWILTAAHCVDGYSSYYYEIQAGLLRRYSFSPMAQTRRANYIKMHPSFERVIMKNDLALIKLNEPLLFNRWIRPTCLPKNSTTESYWRNGPFPDTTCVTIGWGATAEHGPDPDHLREVEVPILRECKHREDRNDAEICAGMPQGGRDACQGDSGGPLMCNYPGSEDQWYVAGIVSHGEGCARPNEPGAYTKVSRFVDWIGEIIGSREIVFGSKPLTVCPGFSCAGGLGKCLPLNKRCDRTVNCLDAEDEINCQAYKDLPAFRNSKGYREPSVVDSKPANEANPSFANYTIGKNETAIEVTTTKITSSESTTTDSISTVNDDENLVPSVEVLPSTTTSSIPSTTRKYNSEEISANVTSSTQAPIATSKPQTPQRRKESPGVLRFVCTRLIQNIPIEKRCDRVIDCEDGTDEDNCTCKDYLTNLYPKAICNGHVDCDDGTDEENCGFCKDDEFVCSRSGTCVPGWKKCDNTTDCPNMEDELDCFALTNGDSVVTDIDKRPHLNLEGVVARWKKGKWQNLCHRLNTSTQARLSEEICVYLGFGSVESVDEVTVRKWPMQIRVSTKNHPIPYKYPPIFDLPEKSDQTCSGLYVRCKPILSANTSNLVITNPKNKNLDYLWPWQASIFTDGIYHCPAILLEHSWLLTSSRCVENLDLAENYTTALFGMAPTYLYVDSPYQQIASIDSIKISKKLDAALLHLEYPINMTRYVQPIFVNKRILPATKKDVCIATGVDKKYRTRTTFLRPVTENCPQCHRCYKNATFEDCNNETSSDWSGTIVCRGSGTWYPAAIFHEKDMLCGFQSVQKLTSIDYGNAHFTEIMEESLKPIAGSKCDGIRCPLGRCIPWDKVCNGIDDCRDGSDENANYCGKRKQLCENTGGIGCKCSKSELRCANGQCVPKEAFCDYKIDCADRSDETPSCTCADYLRLTAPERLCNNVRDCLDKSDENYEQCSCKDASFKCSSGNNATNICISHDFVCDNEIDCPNGEDEKNCRIVRGTLKDPPGTGQVLRRSYGVWHTECFSSPLTSNKEVSDLCRSMGYNFGTALKIDDEESVYGPSMVPERDDFFMLRLNRQTWITTKKDRPLVTLVKAREVCHRALVACS